MNRLRVVVAILAATMGCGLLAGTATAATATVFSEGIPAGTRPLDIATGPDGNLWFTGSGSGSIGRMTPAGAVTLFTHGISPGANPTGIAAGPDGNLWFADYAGNRIGRITRAGTVTEFSAGLTPLAGPHDIAAGPDGNLWFTTPDAALVGRITPSGGITEFTRGIRPDAAPDQIVAGPDGNMWFTDYAGDRIGRITPAGVVTEFPVPDAGPLGIVAGSDGNLWFAAHDAVAIGRITPAGVVTQFPLSPGLGPIYLAPAPSGRLWFVRRATAAIDSISTTGIVAPHEQALGPHLDKTMTAIIAGPDTSLWATSPDEGRILRLTPDQPPPTVAVDAPGPDRLRAGQQPVISRFRIRSVVSATARWATPTTISFRVNAPGVVRISVQRLNQGRRRGTRCVAPTRALIAARAQICPRSIARLGALPPRPSIAGSSTIPFWGRVGGRTLTPGTYRLRATLRTPPGTSKPAMAYFTVTRE